MTLGTADRQAAYLEVRGGLGNQLFQWAYFTLLSEEFPQLRVALDGRQYARPGRRKLHLQGLVSGSGCLAPSLRTRFGWRLAGRLLGTGMAERLAARTPTRPPGRGLELVTSAEELLTRVRSGDSVWSRDYLQDCKPLLPHRAMLAAKLQTLLESSEPAARGRELARRLGEYSALHVRRGDYVSSPRNLERIGICSEAYYRQALESLRPDLPLVMVSDDPEWCRRNLAERYSRPAHVLSGQHELGDLAVLMGASELVVSNSTFSWWAAFAGRATRVIAPQPWFNQPAGGDALVLPEWDRLPRDLSSSNV